VSGGALFEAVSPPLSAGSFMRVRILNRLLYPITDSFVFVTGSCLSAER